MNIKTVLYGIWKLSLTTFVYHVSWQERTNLLNGLKKELKISEDEEIKVIDQIENDSNVNLIRYCNSL